MVHQIIYTSSAGPRLTAHDFREIVMKASVQNARNNITGLLLFHDGGILQVLEGEKDVVHTLYQKIAQDSRHNGLTKLIDRDTPQREFANWSMGFKMITDEDKLDFAFHLNKESFKAQMPTNVSPEVSILTNTYARINGL